MLFSVQSCTTLLSIAQNPAENSTQFEFGNLCKCPKVLLVVRVFFFLKFGPGGIGWVGLPDPPPREGSPTSGGCLHFFCPFFLPPRWPRTPPQGKSCVGAGPPLNKIPACGAGNLSSSFEHLKGMGEPSYNARAVPFLEESVVSGVTISMSLTSVALSFTAHLTLQISEGCRTKTSHPTAGILLRYLKKSKLFFSDWTPTLALFL